MILILVALVVIVVAGIILVRRLAVSSRTRVVIIIKDQEPWVEGVIRKTFRCMKRTAYPVQVVDDCSGDGTFGLLERLRKYYRFEILYGEEAADKKRQTSAIVYDFRGLKGRELFNSPLFCHHRK